MTNLLHIDVTQYGSAPELVAALSERFQVVSCRGEEAMRRIGTERPYFALCFEYDYPDIQTLALLREVKGGHPPLPIVMVTEQHSEALALWALRSRVWDYFVKPVPAQTLLQCFDALLKLPQVKGEEARDLVFPPHPIPAEARFRPAPSAHEPQLRLARDLVDNNMHRKITQTEVAREVGLSACHLSRMFKRTFGIGFQDYLLKRRLEEAQKMLRNRSASIADVCWAVGFRDQSYFSRVFRKAFGCSPSEYREKWRDGACAGKPAQGDGAAAAVT